MRVKIELLTNTIFGSGKNVPGGEDIGLLTDSEGFPYLRGSTFKGILREEVENIIDWENGEKSKADEIFGKGGEYKTGEGRATVSDFVLSDNVKNFIRKQKLSKDRTTECFTDTYTFTSLENGTAKSGSLRSCRYIYKRIIFYGNVNVDKNYRELVKKGISCIKYMGTMRTRGFGNVKVTVEEV